MLAFVEVDARALRYYSKVLKPISSGRYTALGIVISKEQSLVSFMDFGCRAFIQLPTFALPTLYFMPSISLATRKCGHKN